MRRSQHYLAHHQVNQPVQLRLLEIIDENKILLPNDKEVQLQYQLGIMSQNQHHMVQPIRSGELPARRQSGVITLNVPYCALHYSDLLVVQISTSDDTVLASCVLSLFDHRLHLRRHVLQLALWPASYADLSCLSSTNALYKDHNAQELLFMNEQKHFFLSHMDNFSDHDNKSLENLNNKIYYTYRKIPQAFLEVELACNLQVEVPILYQDSKYSYCAHTSVTLDSDTPDPLYASSPFAECLVLHDQEHLLGRSDPVADIDTFLRRDHAHPQSLKPSPEDLIRLNQIVKLPQVNKLREKDKNLLWIYRYHLRNDKHFFCKFVFSVDCRNQQEAEEGTRLIQEWASVDYMEALYLLGQGYCTNDQYVPSVTKGKHRDKDTVLPYFRTVRKHAVATLRAIDDEQLGLILLQLVQALRYELLDEDPRQDKDSLGAVLVGRCTQSLLLSSELYWLLHCAITNNQEKPVVKHYLKNITEWLLERLRADDLHIYTQLQRQIEMRGMLLALCTQVLKKGDTDKRTQEVRRLINEEYGQVQPQCFVMKQKKVVGIRSEKCAVFKSKTAPMRLCFITENGPDYQILYKMNDDLRQDQLVIQLINLLDSLLKGVNLDMRLKPYSVLSYTSQEGLMEFVPNSINLQTVIDQGGITHYIHSLAGDDTALFHQYLDNYVLSCSGYCVITYLLGIGDRHLENLMLDDKGGIFHVDFGFILGKDPKPYPPPFKLNKEMVEPFKNKENPPGLYYKFRQRCVDCYLYLRNKSILILNLLSLMLHASIPAVTQDALDKVEDKFQLHINDEQAEKFFLQLLEQSIEAFFPIFFDKLHKWSQNLKS